MGRPREFDEDVVLDRVVELFRAQGYRATSVEDLVRVTGLYRASLYNAFGDKHDLFVTAVNRYQYTWLVGVIKALRRPGPASAVLRDALAWLVDDVVGRGCLITNTAVELGRADSVAVARVLESWRWLEEALVDVVRRGQASGEFRADCDSSAVARLLVGVIQGIAVMGRPRLGPDSLPDCVSATLELLGPEEAHPE